MQTARENLKLLIVEDDRAYRALAAESLCNFEAFNIRKTMAESARQGLEKFQQEKPDIVLLDIRLPDGSGLDLLEACRKLNPNAFIVMMTGSADARDVQRSKKSGARGYILKPFNTKKMRDVVDVFAHWREEGKKQDTFIDPQEAGIDANALFKTPEQAVPKPTLEELLAEWRILFADRYTVNGDNAKKHLAKYGATVDVVQNGKEAWEKIQKHKYQAMFLDTALPGLDGYQLGNKVRDKDRNEPLKSYIIGMIEKQNEAWLNKWKNAGMNDFVIKPCSFKELERILKKCAKQYYEDLNEIFFD